MPCDNNELMSSGPNWPTIRSYGLIDIDWSNAKAKWVNTAPHMTCEEDLVKQAELIKRDNPLGAAQKVWVYRNPVWAMYGNFRLNLHRFDRFQLDLRGHTQL